VRVLRDEPHRAVVLAFHAHRAAGHEVRILSGRSDEVREATELWLTRYREVVATWLRRHLKMRREGNFTSNQVLKKSWLDEVRAGGGEVDIVYDDRQKVVGMWRANGVACFQVAPGDF
jgi:hypothetical protein